MICTSKVFEMSAAKLKSDLDLVFIRPEKGFFSLIHQNVWLCYNFLNSNKKKLFKFVYVRQIFVQNVKKQGINNVSAIILKPLVYLD
ncbi:hypothetical protein BpHYR1_038041 [Brachionus plicatilis]|uniref:Uncharacterized protein n=1 Tax=Brachionus plicatilis TaxID=10195 RepID=A0A3M7QDV6_BRAPC|nr:hypothetical protein BpHYR1_038041 [Brachionus plicatilis]